MKKIIALLVSCMLVLSLPMALAEGTPLGESTLSVTGSATVVIQPDFATVSLGVTTQAETVGDAQGTNAHQMNAVMAALKEAGISEDDLKTSYFNVSPAYGDASVSYDAVSFPGGGKPMGYRVENNIQVTVRELPRVGEILDIAMKAGANQSYGLSFESTKRAEAYDKALQEAVKEARRKAELMAQATGGQLGALVELQEQGGGYGGMYTKAMSLDSVGGTPVASGTLSVEATVVAVYQLP